MSARLNYRLSKYWQLKLFSKAFVFFALLTLSLVTHSDSFEWIISDDTKRIDLLESSQLYTSTAQLTAPDFENPSNFQRQLSEIDSLKLNGGVYWLNGTIRNTGKHTTFFFEPANAMIDRVELWLNTKQSSQYLLSGFLHPNDTRLQNIQEISLEPETEYEYWVRIQARYIPVIPNLLIETKEQAKRRAFTDNFLVIGCLGALLVLAFYNLVIFLWSHDKSYFYYTLYLLNTSIGWAAVFGIFSEGFGWFSLSLVFIPFYLNVVTSIPFYLTFLNLKNHHPVLTHISKSIAVIAAFLAILSPLISEWLNYLLINVVSIVWLTMGLVAGIRRYQGGFKPARFFILGFAILALGASITVLPLFGVPALVDNTYMTTLVFQTLDATLLALALADRINTLRVEKTEILLQAKQVDEKANKTLVNANAKLQEANLKLTTALQVSEQERNRKDDFILTISHELKTPLNAISASIEQLEDHCEEEETLESIHFIRHGADRLNQQVQNIVMLAETDRREINLTERPFQISHLVTRLHDSAESCLIEKNVQLQIDISENLPESYNGDFYLISHMLMPVVENACRYTLKGKIAIAINPTSTGIEIVISDTGPGIQADKQEEIFKSFSQASTGYGRSAEGLGLGLAVTKRLADVLNSTIDISSKLNEGTEFKIRIPVDIHEGIISNPRKHFEGHALVVEDNEINARVLQAILKKIGMSSEVAVDGNIALSVFTPGRFDLILMDLQMPVMDGFQCSEAIRSKDATVPIIAVTANTDYKARTKCIQSGMTEIIEKPVRRSDIEKFLSAVL